MVQMQCYREKAESRFVLSNWEDGLAINREDCSRRRFEGNTTSSLVIEIRSHLCEQIMLEWDSDQSPARALNLIVGFGKLEFKVGVRTEHESINIEMITKGMSVDGAAGLFKDLFQWRLHFNVKGWRIDKDRGARVGHPKRGERTDYKCLQSKMNKGKTCWISFKRKFIGREN